MLSDLEHVVRPVGIEQLRLDRDPPGIGSAELVNHATSVGRSSDTPRFGQAEQQAVSFVVVTEVSGPQAHEVSPVALNVSLSASTV